MRVEVRVKVRVEVRVAFRVSIRDFHTSRRTGCHGYIYICNAFSSAICYFVFVCFALLFLALNVRTYVRLSNKICSMLCFRYMLCVCLRCTSV